jgi:hypothetical protein
MSRESLMHQCRGNNFCVLFSAELKKGRVGGKNEKCHSKTMMIIVLTKESLQ